MRKFLALSILALLTTSAVAEDFLGTNEPEETEKVEEPKYGWNADHNIWESKNWHVMHYIGCIIGYGSRTRAAGLTELGKQGYRAFWVSLYPAGESEFIKNSITVSHIAYDQLEMESVVGGSIAFDGGKSKKLKFHVSTLSVGIEGAYLTTNNKLDLNIVRSMASSETMVISVDGVEDVTIPLEEVSEAYKALEECYKQAKEE